MRLYFAWGWRCSPILKLEGTTFRRLLKFFYILGSWGRHLPQALTQVVTALYIGMAGRLCSTRLDSGFNHACQIGFSKSTQQLYSNTDDEIQFIYIYTRSAVPRSKKIGLNPGWRVAPNEFLYFSACFFLVSNTFSVVDFRTRIELAIKKVFSGPNWDIKQTSEASTIGAQPYIREKQYFGYSDWANLNLLFT